MANKNYDIGQARTYVTQNKNPLVSTDSFRMVFSRAPNVQYFLQGFSIPSVAVNETTIPRGKQNVYAPGDAIVFDPLTVTMLVSEDMDNFKEMFDWLYREINSNNLEDKYDDVTIYILTSKNNPNKAITFRNIFPTQIGNITFSATEADVIYATLEVTFRYDYFTFE